MLGVTTERPDEPSEPNEPGEPNEPTEPRGTIDEQISRLLDQAQAAFDAANEALAAGDLALYQERIDNAERFIAQAIALDARRDEAENPTRATRPPTRRRPRASPRRRLSPPDLSALESMP